MKVIILDGSNQSIPVLENARIALRSKLEGEGNEVEDYILRDLDMKRCTGCFQCWTKTPGICVFDDDAQRAARMIASADLMVLLTPITFGGYSSLIKVVLDRQICSFLPVFSKIGREVHRPFRYDSYPKILAIGSLEKLDKLHENIFARIVKRNSIGVNVPQSNQLVVYEYEGRDAVSKKLDLVLDGMGVIV